MKKHFFIIFLFAMLFMVKTQDVEARDSYENNCYFYSKISEEERKIYRDLYNSTGDVVISMDDYNINTVEEFETGLYAFMLDFPECQFDSVTYGWDENQKFCYYLKRSTTMPEDATEAAVNSLLSKVSKKNEYDTLKSIHDIVIKNLTYNHANSSYTLYDAAVKKNTRCTGYSKLFQILCRKSGITCIQVFGKALGGGHVWNMVQLSNGKWYEVDCTWDDSDEPYDYFLKTRSQMKSDHTLRTLPVWVNDEYMYTETLLSLLPSTDSSETLLQVGSKFKANDKNYYTVVSPSEVYMTKIKGHKKTVKIPNKVKIKGKTYNVTGIAKNCFKNNRYVEKVIYKSKNKTGAFTVEKGAFVKCKNLKTINLKKAGKVTMEKKAIKGCKKVKVLKSKK